MPIAGAATTATTEGVASLIDVMPEQQQQQQSLHVSDLLDAAHQVNSTETEVIGNLINTVTEQADQMIAQKKEMTTTGSTTTATIVKPGETQTPTVEPAPTPVQSFSRHPPVTLKSCLKDIMAICLPAMGAILADPVMSLVDTACIGQISSLQLAALAPNTAVFNAVFAALYFLQTAVTALVARSLSMADKKKAGDALSNGLFLAATLGIATTIGLELFSEPLLKLMGTSAEFMAPALTYLRIRALAAPAVLTVMVVQGNCYAQTDARTPLKINIAAGLVNLVGDIGLIFGLGFGIAGAAVATVAGQYIAAGLSIFALIRMQKSTAKSLPLTLDRVPSRAQLKPFFDVASVMVTRLMCIMGVYSLATRSAVAMGALPAAAFQVGLEVVWFLSFFPEPLSMAAQALLARLPPGLGYSRQVAVKARAVFVAGAALNLALVTLLCITPFTIFTSDAAVVAMVNNMTVPMCLATVLCTIAMIMDGIFIGLNKFRHLAYFQAFNFVAMATVFATSVHTLDSVMWALVLFFCLRVGEHFAFVAAVHNPFASPLAKKKEHYAVRSFADAGAGI